MTWRSLQNTVRRPVRLAGIGVHSGVQAAVVIHPAEAGRGIVFVHPDDHHGQAEIPAQLSHVGPTDHCTTLVGEGWSIATVEHLLAALAALSIDNAVIEIDGPEVPAMDGSSTQFIAAIDEVGVTTLDAPRRFIRVLRPLRVELGSAVAELRPHDGLRIEIELDYANPIVGKQSYAAEISPAVFRRDIAPARTFGFMADAQALWSRGLALGASLDNALVIGDGHIVNPEGLRFPDEYARHKVIDAVGDLALAGTPILGAYRTYRGGHSLNARMLQALFASADAFERIEAAPVPRRGRATALAGAVFGPELS